MTPRVLELTAAGLVRSVPRIGTALIAEGQRQADEAAARFRLIVRFLAEVLELPINAIASETELFARLASDGIARFLTSAQA